MQKKLLLGTDGLLHLNNHGCAMQEIVIPLPLGMVLSSRCLECGEAKEFEASFNAYCENRSAQLPLEPTKSIHEPTVRCKDCGEKAAILCMSDKCNPYTARS